MVGSGGRHELAASIDGVGAHGGGMVLETFLVGDYRGRRVHVVAVVDGGVALEYAVGEG